MIEIASRHSLPARVRKQDKRALPLRNLRLTTQYAALGTKQDNCLLVKDIKTAVNVNLDIYFVEAVLVKMFVRTIIELYQVYYNNSSMLCLVQLSSEVFALAQRDEKDKTT